MTSGIHKIQKLESVQFTAVPNWVVRDSSYTPNTFRLLAYLLSHEDGYGITYAQIERQTGLGRWAINEAIKFLSSVGWLEVWQPKGADGRFIAKSWIIKNPGVGHSATEPPRTEPLRYGTANGLKEDKGLKKTNTKRRQHTPEARTYFDDFWEQYPRKIDKAKARKAFHSALSKVEFGDLMAGTVIYRDDPNRMDQFTKYPASWLNAESWNNGPLPYDPRAEKERNAIEQEQIKREWGNL